jgi:hypothetical protein
MSGIYSKTLQCEELPERVDQGLIVINNEDAIHCSNLSLDANVFSEEL